MNKGPSNRYKHTRGFKFLKYSKHISYDWAKYFNKKTLKIHFKEHGKNMGYINIEEYKQHAIRFANAINEKEFVSFIDKNYTTYKYNNKTNELVLVKNDGTIITYFKPKEAYEYYKNEKRKKTKKQCR